MSCGIESGAGNNLFDDQFRDSSAICTQHLACILIQHDDLQAFAIRTGGCRFAGRWFGGGQHGFAIEAPGALGIQLEGAATIGADVIEAALRLTGVDDIRALALRTADKLF